jgi:hypothetical protein
MRTLVIAVTALAASAGTSLAQDAAAGEQVFKRRPVTTSERTQR